MSEPASRKHPARVLKTFRTIHRTTGALLFVVFLFISITGLLLGWKKHSGELLLAKTYTGTTPDLKRWLPLDSLEACAISEAKRALGAHHKPEVDRMDVRKEKGTVKFVFTEAYLGIQVDGATGRILHVEHRTSDLIENIHDGSLLDRYLGTSNGQIKLVYTTVSGLALLLFTITGFWLWYGPKWMKKRRNG